MLLAALRANRVATEDAVAAAFLAVPRDRFLPGVPLEQAYRDLPFVTKYDASGLALSSSSQPTTMAMMLDLLGLRPGMRVLEVGAGTGYNAALMSHIVGPGGAVVTVDVDEEVVASAGRNLAAAGYPDVTVVAADGAAGVPRHGPYDRIVVTAGAWDIPPAWIAQLTERGLIVVPLILRIAQRVIAFRRAAEYLSSEQVRDCGFMGGFIQMTGAAGSAERTCALPGLPGIHLRLAGSHRPDPAAVSRALGAPPVTVPTGVTVTMSEVARGLGLWLALAEPRLASLFANGAAAGGDLVPPLVAFPGHRGTAGIADHEGLAVLAPGQPGRAMFDLQVSGMGASGEHLAHQLADHVRTWNAHGRPSTTGLQVHAYPLSSSAAQARHRFAIVKRAVRLGLDWEDLACR